MSKYSPQRNRLFILGCGQSNIFLFHQLAVKGFAFCRQEVHAFFVPQHHINRAGLEMTVRADGGDGSGMNVPHQHFQIIQICHDFLYDVYKALPRTIIRAIL